MKKIILYFAIWFVFANYANDIGNKILMAISCVLAVGIIVYIIKNCTNTKNE